LPLPAPAVRLVSCRNIVILVLISALTGIAASAQTFTSLYSFCSQSNCADGSAPYAGLVQAIDGNFYGTTFRGGVSGVGTAFNISASGTLTSLHSFNGSDGLNPSAGLVQASDGSFYGTTVTGGFINNGNAFQMTPSGMVSQVYSFCSQQGCVGRVAWAGLVQGADGNFYGATQQGGNGSCSGLGVGCGVIFKLTPGGTLTALHAFSGPDGVAPYAGLVQGADGNFYGTTQYGGTGNNNVCIENSNLGCGTVFKITPSGTLTTLYNFCSQPNCADGYSPQAVLVQAADGNFYGTTQWGGTTQGNGNGTIFRITPSGAYTSLHSFAGYPTDGAHPIGGLIQATDGNFYGTTPAGGANFLGGTIYRMTPNGTVTTLYSFCALSQCADGSDSYATLLQGTDGNLYGTTTDGGTSCNGGFCGFGTVFKLSVGLAPFLKLQPGSGGVGTPVTILGTNLSGATSVTFNGTPAAFHVVSSGAITTTVPAGATTGTVQVSTPSGTVNSPTDFLVTGALQFVAVAPCRLVDTRGTGGPIAGGTSRNFTVPQLGGCNIPLTAAAYSLNVTAVPHGALGYLTIWPEGENQPLVSTLNSSDGRAKANAAIVPAGNNAVSVYVTNTSDVILDIDGYLAPAGQSTLQFYPLTPCRVVDTRQTNFAQGLGAPSFGNMESRELPVLRNSPCLQGLPNTPQAYSFNVTVVPHPAGHPLNYLTIWPSNQSQPLVSTLNNPTATVVANAAIVPADPANGDVSVYTYDSTDVIIDINGYFAAAGTGGYSFYSVAPCRVLDTRNIGSGQPFSGTLSPPVDVPSSPCAPPLAQGYVFNATVVPSPTLGYLTLWPDSEMIPIVSTLNAYDGLVTSNMAIVPSVNGKIDAYADGTTQLILDISGYFAP